MKQIVLAALIGMISAVRVNEEYRPNPVQSPWAAKPKKGETNTLTGGWKAGAPYYDRVMPERFT